MLEKQCWRTASGQVLHTELLLILSWSTGNPRRKESQLRQIKESLNAMQLSDGRLVCQSGTHADEGDSGSGLLRFVKKAQTLHRTVPELFQVNWSGLFTELCLRKKEIASSLLSCLQIAYSIISIIASERIRIWMWRIALKTIGHMKRLEFGRALSMFDLHL